MREISLDSVLNRACDKYEERIAGIENGIEWNVTKKKQKVKLKDEQFNLTTN